MRQRRARLGEGFVDAVSRDGLADELHRRILEDPRRSSLVRADDAAAGRNIEGIGESGSPERGRVGERHVPVQPFDEDRMRRRRGVDIVARRQPLRRPGLVIPVAAANPGPRRQGRGVSREARRHLCGVTRRPQIDADDLGRAANQVHVRVVEAGQHQPAAGVEDPGR